jgi:hypothetical protein
MRKIFFGWLKEWSDKRKTTKENKKKMAAQDMAALEQQIEKIILEGGSIDYSCARRDQISYEIRSLRNEIERN